MKKIFIALAMMAALMLTSCEEGDFKISYNVDIVGDALGDVLLTFPDGKFDLKGDADLTFHYGNTGVAEFTLSEALQSNDAKVLKAAEAVKADIDKAFSATALEGSYYFHIGGYAEAYGVKIAIDETFTNRENVAE